MSSASLELELSGNGGSTLPLFDDSPVRDKSSRKLGVQHSVSSSIEVASQLWLNKDEVTRFFYLIQFSCCRDPSEIRCSTFLNVLKLVFTGGSFGGRVEQGERGK